MKRVYWFIAALVLVLPVFLLDRLPKGTFDPAIIYVLSVILGYMIGACTWNAIKNRKKK